MPKDDEMSKKGTSETDDTDEMDDQNDDSSSENDKDESKSSKNAGKTYDEKYVSKLSKENARRRKENEDLAARLKELEDKNLSEEEQKNKRLKELEAENKRLLRAQEDAIYRDAIVKACNKLNVIDTDAVVKLIDRDEIEIVDGKLYGVTDAVRELLKSKPYLKNTGKKSAKTEEADDIDDDTDQDDDDGDAGDSIPAKGTRNLPVNVKNLTNTEDYKKNRESIIKKINQGQYRD